MHTCPILYIGDKSYFVRTYIHTSNHTHLHTYTSTYLHTYLDAYIIMSTHIYLHPILD
ncbi:hypothetical protein Hanom_Chr05g00463731 [Helianthus anomalus]